MIYAVRTQPICAVSSYQLAPPEIMYIHRNKQRDSWCMLFSETGFILVNPNSGKKCMLRNERTLSIMTYKGAVWVNGNRMPHASLDVYPVAGYMMCNSALVRRVTLACTRPCVEYISYQDEVPFDMILSSLDSVYVANSHTLEQFQLLGQASEQIIQPPRALNVRVLLDERNLDGTHHWILKSPGGFLIHDDTAQRKKQVCGSDSLQVTYKKGSFYLNGKKMSGSQIFIKPKEQYITLNDGTYQGGLWLVQDASGIQVINCLAIEDYVFSVLRTESWPGWPLEVNKVFAIASRTYVVSMVLSARKSKRLYHVKNTNEHQTYSGVHACPVIKQAVQETMGVFLTYNERPIVAMFDCCCGGLIPAHIEGVNFNDAPYLARTYACTHCKRCKIYAWQAEYTVDEFEHIIKKHVNNFSRLECINIRRHDQAGVVQEAIIKGLSHQVALSGKEFYRLHKDIKSFAFSIEHQLDRIIFKGRGYGHHLGLCQWGAREMVREGWDFKKILQFYYPGTDFMRLM